MYLIPEPKEKKEMEGGFALSFKTRIVLKDETENGLLYAGMLKSCIEEWAGFSPDIVRGREKEGDICLKLCEGLKAEEYHIEIRGEGILAEGGEEAGILYAVSTLCQLIEQQGNCLPCMEIKDEPDMPVRGYYLDQTRGRVLKLEELKKTVDRLCRYKMNQLQLYVEHTYLFQGLSEMWRDETPLAAEEILELDDYCRRRHIELVPSLASFGHLYMLLSTKTCCGLCELENSEKQPFSFEDRMRHHTINAADPKALQLIKDMAKEYMSLFSSSKFNLCADETFDLGRGRSGKLAEEQGVHRMYVDYVKELCSFLKEEGKQPMFWGDIICGQPDLIRELPESVICLNWGYAPDQSEEPCRALAFAGASQYLCPGVCGWNQWMNLLEDSYHNIVRMCSYGRKYHVVGILNTDWGDFGHINDPAFSVPGMIYGAAFSWNGEEISFDEMNRRISAVEYHDVSEALTGCLANISKYSVFQWRDAVLYYEILELGEDRTKISQLRLSDSREIMERSDRALENIACKIKACAKHMKGKEKGILEKCDIAIEGIRVWNAAGSWLIKAAEQKSQEEGYAAAQRLEEWFMAYKKEWRKSSREGDLNHISKIVFWYADKMRGRERRNRKIR